MLRDSILYKTAQLSREYDNGKYFSVIDQVELAEIQNRDIKVIRRELVDFYRSSAPQLFNAINNCDRQLGDISASVRKSVYILGRIENSLDQIRHSIDYGFESVIERIDIGNNILNDIRNILSQPVKTQANEFLPTAWGFFQDGLFEEAVEDFEQVVSLDRANYVAWFMIGLIKTERFGDVEGALGAFEKCDRYASKRDAKYYSKSLLQQSLIARSSKEDLNSAFQLATKSYNADSSNFQSCFLAAELSAEKGLITESENFLKKCEIIDSFFYLRSSTSIPLVNSGVHDRVFAKASKELFDFNKKTIEALELTKPHIKHLLSMVDSSGASVVAQKFKVVLDGPKLTNEDDYLLMRSLHDVLDAKIQPLNSEITSGIKSAETVIYGRLSSQRDKVAKKEIKRKALFYAVTIIASILLLVISAIQSFDDFMKAGILGIIGFIIAGVLVGGVMVAITFAIFGVVLAPLHMFLSFIDNENIKTKVNNENTVISELAQALGSIPRRNYYSNPYPTEQNSEILVGKIMEGTVIKTMNFGAFVTLKPGRDGLVHISELSNESVQNVTDVVKEGDVIKVKVLEVDKQGRIRLSMKAVTE